MRPKMWRMPKPWGQFHPDLELAAELYQARAGHVRAEIHACQTADDVSDAFLTWARAVEESVDVSLQNSHASDPVKHPFANLPRSAKGSSSKA